ncbi:SGNH/GDSL hydrolase family protein [Shimia abyssi]|uniref:GDSL-like lipase/acylhydrolase family protein n=1 Tax=Shimia abyssi TaxID=1662395 RepID=A0A2P8FE87_9RHOB|nr:SGNH/GDSL hydrolase family protein [Shimia abyssi]PSL20027.1 hypothetical protein CLV88_10486 [Shimia abyssi]
MNVKTLLTVLGIGLSASWAGAGEFKSPDILVLGDSQVSFGSGPAYVSFFENLKENCQPNKRQARQLKKLGEASVGVIGVRSTSLHSWNAKSGKAKGMICDVDPKWKVNAGSYGILNTTKNPYVQIGQGAKYQFCQKNTPAFKAMLRPNYYEPKLLIMAFLGNSTGTWIDEPAKAVTDVKVMEKNLPPDMPCIFMTTAPGYSEKINARRRAAQESIRAAFAKTGSRCSFISGLTPKTEALNEGVKSHFRRKQSGAVRDPYHPNKKAARKHLGALRGELCNAIYDQLSDMETAALVE